MISAPPTAQIPAEPRDAPSDTSGQKNRAQPATCPWSELARYDFDSTIRAHWEQAYPEGLLASQRMMLLDSGLLNGESRLLMAPTGSGKTLVAEIAAWRHLSEGKRALYLVPTRALAADVADRLAPSFLPGGRKLIVGTRDHSENDIPLIHGRFDLAVLIYEKFQALVMQSPTFLQDVGLVVIDELQSIASGRRGAMLDLTLTWLRERHPDLQLLGLSSATRSPHRLDTWLGARLVPAPERPLPLREGVLDAESGVYQFHEGNAFRPLEEQLAVVDADAEEAGEGLAGSRRQLTVRTLWWLAESTEESVLVFLPTKPETMRAAKLAASLKPEQYTQGFDGELGGEFPVFQETLLGDLLREVMEAGVAFHHADMPQAMRQLVESWFREKKIRLLFCTSTLSQGVNLGASTVVSSAVMPSESDSGQQARMGRIDLAQFINQGGRAGRPSDGNESTGRSMVLAYGRGEATRLWKSLIECEPPPLHSSLHHLPLNQTLLLVLGYIGQAVSVNDLTRFLRTTYAESYLDSTERAPLPTSENIQEVLSLLTSMCMVVGDETQRYSLTAVGQITAQHGILPETGHYFTSWLKSYFSGEDTEIPSLLHLLFTLARSPDAQVRPFPRPRNVRGAQQNGSDIIDRLRSEILEQSHNGRLPTDLQRFFESETGFSPQDRLVAHKTLAMWDWINDASTRDLESRYHLMAGGFQQHGRDFQWLAETLAALAASLNLSADLVQSLSNLARRLPLGLIEPAMSLAPLARAGLIRDDAHRLCPEGWNTLEALADVPLELLQNVIPVYKARPLQELSGQLVARYRENQSLLQSLTKSATQAEPTKPVSDPTATRGETLMTPNESEQNELSMLSGEISEDAENTASGKQPNQLAIMLSRQPNGEVVINGERHPLKPISSQLLYLLAENLGKCVSYKEIALKIWGTHKLGGNDQIHQHKAELLKVFKNAIRKDGTAALVLRTIPRHGLCLNLKPDQFQWVE